MRRLTKAQPMGGASLCSFCSSAAYSGGNRSGMVAINWATFISGPFEPPERRRQRARVAGAVGLAAEQPPAGIARRHAADIGADPRITRGAGGQTVLLAVSHEPCAAIMLHNRHWQDGPRNETRNYGLRVDRPDRGQRCRRRVSRSVALGLYRPARRPADHFLPLGADRGAEQDFARHAPRRHLPRRPDKGIGRLRRLQSRRRQCRFPTQDDL